MYQILTEKLWFPPVETADENGLLAIGGDLSVERLQLAYQNGIFPWYNQGEPIIWYSPPQRMVLFPDDVKVSKSMVQLIKQNRYRITFNQAFKEVIYNCKFIERKEEVGTWITNEMYQAYLNLFEHQLAKSIEVWLDNELVGGLYGVDMGHVFCGESMFSKQSNTSKLALIELCKSGFNGRYKLIDCQVYNSHLASMGAKEIPRKTFLDILSNPTD